MAVPQAIQGKPIPEIVDPETKRRLLREELTCLATCSARHTDELRRLDAADEAARRDRELLEWAAQISEKAAERLRVLKRDEAAEKEAWRRAAEYAEFLRETTWDPSKHPRGAFPQNRGWFSPTHGQASPVLRAATGTPFHTAGFRKSSAVVRLAATGSSTWPLPVPLTSPVPKPGLGAAAGVGTAAGVAAAGLLSGLKNASMGAYWARVPATQVMPEYWVYDLDKRVKAGRLTPEDAIGILQTAILGAEAQNFKPTGTTMQAVHTSIMNFLAQAEAVYFGRKKSADTADAKGGESAPKRVTGKALAEARREFKRMSPSLWKEEARRNPSKYTKRQLDQMRRGECRQDAMESQWKFIIARR